MAAYRPESKHTTYIPKDFIKGDIANDMVKRMQQLSFAIIQRNYDEVDRILAMGADLNYKGKIRRTPIMYASWKHRPQILPQLLAHPGIDVNVGDPIGNTALHLAMETSNGTAVLQLLDVDHINVNQRTKKGETALLLSVAKCPIHIIAALLERNADVNIPDGRGFTPLMLASKTHTPEVIDLMLNYGADVNALDNKGRPALVWGSIRNNAPCVGRLLQENDIDINIEDNVDHLCAFEWAIWKNKTQVIVEFLNSNRAPSMLHPKFRRHADENVMGHIESYFTIVQKRKNSRLASIFWEATKREIIILFQSVILKPRLAADNIACIAEYSV